VGEIVPVLVVDDSKTARMQIKKALQEAGYEVLEAGTADEALAILLAGETIDLVLTDQNMPEKTGIEMVRELRSAKGSANCDVRVIFLSSDSTIEIRTAAKELGAKGFISKPIRPSQVIEAIKKLGV
jgi:two-component system chemotaxis response regulator CheY